MQYSHTRLVIPGWVTQSGSNLLPQWRGASLLGCVVVTRQAGLLHPVTHLRRMDLQRHTYLTEAEPIDAVRGHGDAVALGNSKAVCRSATGCCTASTMLVLTFVRTGKAHNRTVEQRFAAVMVRRQLRVRVCVCVFCVCVAACVWRAVCVYVCMYVVSTCVVVGGDYRDHRCAQTVLLPRCTAPGCVFTKEARITRAHGRVSITNPARLPLRLLDNDYEVLGLSPGCVL